MLVASLRQAACLAPLGCPDYMSLSAMRKETSSPVSASKAAPAVRMVEVGAEHAGQRLDNFLMRLCKGVPKTHI